MHKKQCFIKAFIGFYIYYSYFLNFVLISNYKLIKINLKTAFIDNNNIFSNIFIKLYIYI